MVYTKASKPLGLATGGVMNKEDWRRAAMLVMLVVLVYTAPEWLAANQAKASTYDAPWVYPGLEPAVHR